MAGISNRFAVYITGGRILSMLAGFIMPVVLVRIMPQEDYGLTSQFLTLYMSVYTIAALGIHTNIFYFCSSAGKEKSDKYVANTLYLLIVFGVLCGIILFIPPITNLVFGESELGRHSDLIILSIALATIMNIVSPLSTIRQDKWGALLFPGFIAFGRIGAIICSFLLFSDIHQMFLWLFIFQCVISMIIILYAKKSTELKCNIGMMKEQLIYSLPFGIAVALQLFSNYFDKFVCIRFLSPTEYAIYGVAFLSIPGITQIYDSLCQVNIVNMANSFRQGRINDIIPQYGNFVIKTLSFSVPLILVVALYAEEIMSFLYTPSYQSAAPYFRLYSLTFLASMLGAGTILRSMGKTKLSLCSFVVTCIIGLPSTYYLIKAFGTAGAIWGAVINIMLPRFIQMFFEIYVTNSTIAAFLPWKKISEIGCYSLGLLIPLIVIKHYLSFNIWICVVEGGLYVVLTYYCLISRNLFIINIETLNSMRLKIWRKIRI